MGGTGKNAGRIAAIALVLASLNGCMLDPLYAVYAVAGVGDDDTPAPSAQGWTATSVAVGQDDASLYNLIRNETAERYRARNCYVMQLDHVQVADYHVSPNPLVRQYGDARNTAIQQAWKDKGCSPAYVPLGRVGATILTVDPAKARMQGLPGSGVVILSTAAGSPASQAGLMARDVVVAIGEQPIADDDDYIEKVLGTAPGTTLAMKVWRNGGFLNIPVVLGSAVPAQSALPATTPVAKATSAAPAQSLQGMSLGAVTASYAQAVGMPSTRGAWVIDTLKGSAADTAGIKPLDVIVEVGGQAIDSPQDLTALSARMRAGYKTTVSLWRDHARHDVQMVLNDE